VSSSDLARRIAYWTKQHNFCGEVLTRRRLDQYTIEFVARTTKTRASSMVTRVKLIANEVLGGAQHTVDKQLLSDPPEDRASLSTWRIFIAIPIKKKELKAA